GPPAGAHEGGIVGLGSFFEGALAEEVGNGRWKLRDQIVVRGNALAVVDGSGIGHGGARGEGVGRGVGDVGDENRNLLGGKGGMGEASTFDGGEVLADGVDGGDGRAGVDERAVGRDQIGEGDFGVNRLFDDGRASAGKQKDDERVGVERAERFEDRFGGLNGFGGGGGMASMKIAEAADLAGLAQSSGIDGGGDYACFGTAAADLRFERGGHGVGGFADGDDEDAVVGVEVVEIFANAQD